MAVKQLMFSTVDDELVAELYLAPKLHSQYIVPIKLTFFDGYSDGKLAVSIVMEYCSGGSLTRLKTEVSIFFVLLFYKPVLLEGSRDSACLSVKGTTVLKEP